jgi:hypothetical protein
MPILAFSTNLARSRTNQCRHDPGGNRHRPVRVPRRGTLRLLGGALPRQPRVRQQAQNGQSPQGGNHAIRYLLCEAANAARRTNSSFRSFYQSLVGRKGHKKAIIAVAHKMLRVIYFMFTRRQAYRDAGIDYQALVVDRNAPRWIQALKKYGYWLKSGQAETPVPAPVPA